MLSDTEFSHQLDVALAPIIKKSQRIATFHNLHGDLGGSLSEGTISLGSSLHCSTFARTAESVARKFPETQKDGDVFDTEAKMREIATAECKSYVEGLQEWLENAKHGKQVGEQCLGVLKHLSSCLCSMRDVTISVQEQSNHLSNNASALMVRKTKLETVQEELQRMIKHFSHIEILVQEAEQQTLSATSHRYPNMLQEMDEEMQFLSRNSQSLSSKTYATKLASAQQRAFQCLKHALTASFQDAQNATIAADVYRAALYHKREGVYDAGTEVEGNDTMAQSRTVCGLEDTLTLQRKVFEIFSNINSIFQEKLDEKASLRRIIEARDAEGQVEEEMSDKDVFDAYCDVRVSIVGPLLQNWLRASFDGGTEEKPMHQIVIYLVVLVRGALLHEKKLFDEVWLREDFSARIFPELIAGISGEVYHVFRSRLLQVDELKELAQSVEEIQRANSRHENAVEISGLLTKMIQDTQERLIFRTSVFLRQSIARCVTTKAMAQEFEGLSVPAAEDFYIPALKNCVTLLQLLYPSLEFPIFSVFAEEAIHCTLMQVQDLAKLIGQQRGEHSVMRGLMCQLRHLLFLREELSYINENITVVERSIDLAKIAQRRLEIVQSARESKKDVESEIKACCERIAQILFADVSSPLAGIARKKPEAVATAVEAVKQRWREREDLLNLYIPNASAREVLLRPAKIRLDELLTEAALIHDQQEHELSNCDAPTV